MKLKNLRFLTKPCSGGVIDVVEVTLEMDREEFREMFKIEIDFVKKRIEGKK